MKLGIMQPYFLPYIGYWQLMNAVDKYVVYDDVNFIKGGWINRNRILLNGEPKYYNVPVLGASPNKLINEITVNNNKYLVNKNLRMIESAYRKAPYYETVYPMIESILNCRKKRLSEYLIFSFGIICRYLGIKTELILSSSLKKNNDLRAQEKVLEICGLLGASEYYNAIGGQSLYCFEAFKKRNIQLKFLKTELIEYTQFKNNFQADLSILDVMMFNSKVDIKKMLDNYSVIGC